MRQKIQDQVGVTISEENSGTGCVWCVCDMQYCCMNHHQTKSPSASTPHFIFMPVRIFLMKSHFAKKPHVDAKLNILIQALLANTFLLLQLDKHNNIGIGY